MILGSLNTEVLHGWVGSVLVLLHGHLPGGEADRVDRVAEDQRTSQVQQGDVPVQVLLPVVPRVDDDFADGHDLLDAALEPGTKSW